MIKNDWTIQEITELFKIPLIPLLFRANAIHAEYHTPGKVQMCSLISIKTGGCPEDCKYCPQSAHNQADVKPQPLMRYEDVIAQAQEGIKKGATRICLGAAIREVQDNHQFDEMLKMVRGIQALGVEVCCTFGMLKPHQAARLKEAGIYAYNHNLDSSEKFYKTIITTRTYQDRLDTLATVRQAGISVCCGGIVGMGEEEQDRIELLYALSKINPDSVPINRLYSLPTMPLANQKMIPIWDMVRMVAAARIIFPKAMVRLSCGRTQMSYTEQALCFLAGANSIHGGEKLFIFPNDPKDRDAEMFQLLGLNAFKTPTAGQPA